MIVCDARNLYTHYYMNVNPHNREAAVFACACNFTRDYNMMILTKIIVHGSYLSIEHVRIC